MKRFARLYAELDATTSTREKLAALARYYAQAPAADAAWATYFLAGGKPRAVVPSRLLREIALRASGLDEWLLEECYLAVGDFSETVALVLPPPTRGDDTGLAQWVEQRLAPLRGERPAVIEARLRDYWDMLDTRERFLLGKLIGGAFRVGVSRLLVQRALAAHAGIDAKTVAHRAGLRRVARCGGCASLWRTAVSFLPRSPTQCLAGDSWRCVQLDGRVEI